MEIHRSIVGGVFASVWPENGKGGKVCKGRGGIMYAPRHTMRIHAGDVGMNDDSSDAGGEMDKIEAKLRAKVSGIVLARLSNTYAQHYAWNVTEGDVNALVDFAQRQYPGASCKTVDGSLALFVPKHRGLNGMHAVTSASAGAIFTRILSYFVILGCAVYIFKQILF